MQHAHRSRDLLRDWESDRTSSIRRKKLSVGLVLAISAISAICEPFIWGSTKLLLSFSMFILGLIVLAVAVGYSTLIFFAGWRYAQWLLRKGQTRISIWQLAVIATLSALLTLPVYAYAYGSSQSNLFWLALGFLFWNSISCAILGYATPFYFKDRGAR